MRRLPRNASRLAGAFLTLAAVLLLASANACTANITMPSNRYAVVIGVQDYPGIDTKDWYDLSYTENDANEMASLLASNGWTVAKKLLSAAATQDAIKSAIDDLAVLIGTDSEATALVYYSGHGDVDAVSGTGYLIPYDGISFSDNTMSFDKTKWVTPAAMSLWLGQVGCKNKLLVLDSCYSGSFVEAGGSIDISPQDSNTYTGTKEKDVLATAFANFAGLLAASLDAGGDPSVTAITASGSEELSYDDSSTQNGAFTYYFLESATKGDSDGDGFVTATEALAYAKAKLKANWNMKNSYLGQALLPHISGGAGNLVLFAPGT